MRTVLCVVCVALVGFVTVAPSPAPHPCLPPGVSADFFYWPVSIAQSSPLAAKVRYEQGDRAVLVIWLGPFLALVDDDPDGIAAPWIDRGVVRADGRDGQVFVDTGRQEGERRAA